MYFNVSNKYRAFKKTKILYIFKNALSLSILLFTVSVVINMKKYLKKNNQLKY